MHKRALLADVQDTYMNQSLQSWLHFQKSLSVDFRYGRLWVVLQPLRWRSVECVIHH